MLRNLIIFGLCTVVAAALTTFWQADPQGVESVVRTLASQEQDTAAAVQPTAAPKAVHTGRSITGRRMRLEQDARGHFSGEFKLNGRRVDAMVDTGATAVAINLSTARRIGIAMTAADLTQSVSTANGEARAGMAIIDRVDLGRISVENVRAVVLEDNALDGVLIGMTFLSRLKTFAVDDGALTLTQ